MNNFEFLKTIDKSLYEIISDAENLYRDEYFEQCITQTRRFGEIICKNVLGNSRTLEKTFDDMLATLKDKVSTSIQEKEFVDDLYFLKKEGNHSVECLQRSFEISIYYAVYYKKINSNLLKLQYDTEMLITGKKTKKTLAEKYKEEKAKNKLSTKKSTKKVYKTTSQPQKKFSIFWLFLVSFYFFRQRKMKRAHVCGLFCV